VVLRSKDTALSRWTYWKIFWLKFLFSAFYQVIRNSPLLVLVVVSQQTSRQTGILIDFYINNVLFISTCHFSLIYHRSHAFVQFHWWFWCLKLCLIFLYHRSHAFVAHECTVRVSLLLGIQLNWWTFIVICEYYCKRWSAKKRVNTVDDKVRMVPLNQGLPSLLNSYVLENAVSRCVDYHFPSSFPPCEILLKVNVMYLAPLLQPSPRTWHIVEAPDTSP
jgi:hypothetical protein